MNYRVVAGGKRIGVGNYAHFVGVYRDAKNYREYVIVLEGYRVVVCN